MSKEFSEKLRNEQKARLEKSHNAFAAEFSTGSLNCLRVHVGVATIIRRRTSDPHEVLMGLRKGKHGAGTWMFPGGWMEHGEVPAQSAYREVLEETGLVVADVVPYRVPYATALFEDGTHSLTLFYKALVPIGAEPVLKEPDKCERWEWFAVNKLPSPLFKSIVNADIATALYRDWDGDR